MIKIKLYNVMVKPDILERTKIVNFLNENMGEYGDPKPIISGSISHALKEQSFLGGFVITSYNDKKISGVVVVNQTGMQKYYPENLLVYFAVDNKYNGEDIKKELLEQTIAMAKGDIAVHVEPDNPLLILFKEAGFTNKYLDLRFSRPKKKSN
ncbi:MAG: GNAT family N-acetyltransferase [Bacteroidetes bacterium]|nr:GNAT family N-acetyltransferase [Bacteroidota bacterium]MBL6943017.1 GNAT family N-acetyltransferase [Bacteroidales bacterium]